MKRCPKCNTDYFDNMLVFCLDDGERLLQSKETNLKAFAPDSLETLVSDNNSFPADLSSRNPTENIRTAAKNEINKSEKIKQKVTLQWLKTLEIAPIIFALAHNYWQWLYLARKNYYDFTSFFISADFLIWLTLLITGLVFGILSLKFNQKRGFAITALVVLAIDVILAIVPK